jgi:hypothetical protein
VGVVPAAWDGEGSAEWVTGEEPTFALRSTRSVGHLILTLDDGAPALVPWPGEADEVYMSVPEATPGTHELRISLLSSDVDQPVAEGVVDIVVRPPQLRHTSGSFREGLLILANPVSPTLEELWEGKAFLRLLGPRDARVAIDISLLDGRRLRLGHRRAHVTLPYEEQEWHRLVTTEVRRDPDLRRVIEDSEACEIVVSHPELGRVTLTCDREFAVLRWARGFDRQGMNVRLVDNADAGAVSIEHLRFEAPDWSLPVASTDDILRFPEGGLVTASTHGTRVSVVVSRTIRSLADIRDVEPVLSATVRSIDGVKRKLEKAAQWSAAEVPADVVTEGDIRAVKRAFAEHLAEVICGTRWAQAENQFSRRRASIRHLADAIGRRSDQQSLAEMLLKFLPLIEPLEPSKRAEQIALALTTHSAGVALVREDVTLTEFVLRFASDPGSLVDMPAEHSEAHLSTTLATPTLLRAARLVVLATAHSDDEETTAAYEGWTWK